MIDLSFEPTWQACAGCGVETMRERCWSCHEAAEAAAALSDATRVAEATIPERWSWARLDSPRLRQHVRSRMAPDRIGREFILRSHMTLLHGPAGCGKTSLAIATMRERISGAVFVDASDLAASTMQHRLGDGESAMFERARDARLLVIDELKHPGNEVRAKEIERLINARHGRSSAITIVTSALAPKGYIKPSGEEVRGILEIFGDGVFRRLCERGSALVVELGREGDA